jgi:hypothetical protein
MKNYGVKQLRVEIPDNCYWGPAVDPFCISKRGRVKKLLRRRPGCKIRDIGQHLSMFHQPRKIVEVRRMTIRRLPVSQIQRGKPDDNN